MSMLEATATVPLVSALGWALVHFVWQGTLIAAVLAAVLCGLRRRSADARYVTCCAAMALMALAPVVTFAALLRGQPAPVHGGAGGLLPPAAGTAATWSRLDALLPQLTALWIVGVCILQARLLAQWTGAQRIKSRGGRRAPEPCRRCLADLRERLGIRRAVQIFESGRAAVPMLIGWLRPVILVPAGAVTGLSPQQLRAVLAHELAHVRRHDYLVNVLQAFLESLLFYHPAVWWVSHRIRVEREYCCDDVAVGAGGDALSYAQALAYLDALRGETYRPALASTGGSLMNRIRRVVGMPTVPASRFGGWVAPAAAMLAVVTALSAVSLARPVAEEHAEHVDAVELAPLPEADVVAALEALDAREAPLFRLLRDAGLDDRTLVMVLEAMDASPRALRAVRQGPGRRPFLETRLRRIHEEVRSDLEAGRITEQEAERRLDRARQEIHEHLEAARPRQGRAEDRLRLLRDRIEEELAAGRITADEARRRLDQIRARQEMILVERQRRQAMAQQAAERLNAIGDEIHRDLEAGVITEDEARRRMHHAMQEIHEELGPRFHGPRPPLPRAFADRMRAIHEEIAADLEAGLITEDEAHQRLDRARQEIQEQLEKTQRERHRHRGRHE
jgi:beta-lactamase regulating signal transducer with metallopeptidase domain